MSPTKCITTQISLVLAFLISTALSQLSKALNFSFLNAWPAKSEMAQNIFFSFLYLHGNYKMLKTISDSTQCFKSQYMVCNWCSFSLRLQTEATCCVTDFFFFNYRVFKDIFIVSKYLYINKWYTVFTKKKRSFEATLRLLIPWLCFISYCIPLIVLGVLGVLINALSYLWKISA